MGQLLPDADIESFQPLQSGVPDTNYSKDKYRVYKNNEIYAEADPKTFHPGLACNSNLLMDAKSYRKISDWCKVDSKMVCCYYTRLPMIDDTSSVELVMEDKRDVQVILKVKDKYLRFSGFFKPEKTLDVSVLDENEMAYHLNKSDSK